METLNHDIYNLIRRLRRFKKEMIKCVSSNVVSLSSFDLQRLNSYLTALKFFKTWMTSQPELDLPATSPRTIEFDADSEIMDVENDDLAVIVDLFHTIELEMVNSVSSRSASGLNEHDAIRFDSYVSKIEQFVTQFVDPTNSLDLPESTPSVAITGAGNTGITV